MVRVRAGNPSPGTLEGTNSYLAGGWVVDPGPDDRAHRDRLLAAARPGGIEGIVVTHGHPDHAAGAPALAALAGVPVTRPSAEGRIGPFAVLPTPGHAPDHVCLLLGGVCFSGDLVLGSGSVRVESLGPYLDSLQRLRARRPRVLCPGHGPFVWDVVGRLDAYVAHRLDRERRLESALRAGMRSRAALLDAAWPDVPPHLRGGAARTLAAHLRKLRDEGRLPQDGPDPDLLDYFPRNN